MKRKKENRKKGKVSRGFMIEWKNLVRKRASEFDGPPPCNGVRIVPCCASNFSHGTLYSLAFIAITLL
jgi:hypothetical protein